MLFTIFLIKITPAAAIVQNLNCRQGDTDGSESGYLLADIS